MAPITSPTAPDDASTLTAEALLESVPDSTMAYLRTEFPEWTFTVDVSTGWNGTPKPLWVATRDGHHPQAERSPGRLHTRLEEYLQRVAHRTPSSN